MALVRQFGASPPPAEEVARVTERVVRGNRLLAAEGALVPLATARELDLPHEVVEVEGDDVKRAAEALGRHVSSLAPAGVRTAAVAEPDASSRAPAPEPEREYACPECDDWSTTSQGALTRHMNAEHGGDE